RIGLSVVFLIAAITSPASLGKLASTTATYSSKTTQMLLVPPKGMLEPSGPMDEKRKKTPGAISLTSSNFILGISSAARRPTNATRHTSKRRTHDKRRMTESPQQYPVRRDPKGCERQAPWPIYAGKPPQATVYHSRCATVVTAVAEPPP